VAGKPNREIPSGGGGTPTADAATQAEAEGRNSLATAERVRFVTSPRPEAVPCAKHRCFVARRGRDLSWEKGRGCCVARSRLVRLSHCRERARAQGYRRVLTVPLARDGGAWVLSQSLRRGRNVGQGRRSRPFSVLVFLTARTEPHPEERPREAPGAHPAPGGRVHFAAQAGQLANCGWAGPLNFGGERPEVWEGDAISRLGRAGFGLFHGGGEIPSGGRGSEHMAA
jgi:hypothetical protein